MRLLKKKKKRKKKMLCSGVAIDNNRMKELLFDWRPMGVDALQFHLMRSIWHSNDGKTNLMVRKHFFFKTVTDNRETEKKTPATST